MDDTQSEDSGLQNDLEHLKGVLGEEFVSWVLGDLSELSENQREVLKALKGGAWPSDRSEVFMKIAPLFFTDEATGVTVMSWIREVTGSSAMDPEIPETEDPVSNALMRLVVETYGFYLLEETVGRGLMLPTRSGAARDAMNAIRNDGELPFAPESGDFDSVYVVLSVGSAGDLNLAFAPHSMLNSAWRKAKLHGAYPDCLAVMNEVPGVVSDARRAHKTRRVNATGLAGISGVVGPPGVSLDLPWGRLRSAHRGDPPLLPGLSPAENKRSLQREDGSIVTISDSGDLVVETEMPVNIAFFDELPEGRHPRPKVTGNELLAKRMNIVRLAFLLSWIGDDAPVIVPAWSLFILPLRHGDSWSTEDLGSYAERTPTELSIEQMKSWAEWVHRLDGVPFDPIALAAQRIIKASAERKDPYDSLIDAVIAWEALFGAETEISFRVSGALARLLVDAGPERLDFRNRAASIYKLRSTVVHGGKASHGEVQSGAIEAIRIGKEAIRRLVRDRPDLIGMVSAQRSNALLLE